MGTMHVVPRGDLVEHEADDGCVCVCGPQPQYVEAESYADGEPVGAIGGWVVVHHSLDGREQHEPAATDPS